KYNYKRESSNTKANERPNNKPPAPSNAKEQHGFFRLWQYFLYHLSYYTIYTTFDCCNCISAILWPCLLVQRLSPQQLQHLFHCLLLKQLSLRCAKVFCT